MRSYLAPAIALILSVPLADAAVAQPSQSKVGTLNCNISAGMGYIIGSRKRVRCRFTPSGRGVREFYVGSITKFGLDVGVTAGARMVWAVFAQTSLPRRGALAGTYTGASGEATVGAGLGANVLVGGNNRTVALQPVSVQAQAGFNVAVGVSGLELAPAR